MQRILLASVAGLVLSACAYNPKPTNLVHIVSSPTDVLYCTRLGEVSPVVPTTAGFDAVINAMLARTVELGGTHLYLDQYTADWLLVRGTAYWCAGSAAVSVRPVGLVR